MVSVWSVEVRRWLAIEPVKLAMAAIAIALLQLCMTSMSPSAGMWVLFLEISGSMQEMIALAVDAHKERGFTSAVTELHCGCEILGMWSDEVSMALASAQTYGDNAMNFMNFKGFSRLCGSLTTCAVAGAVTLGQKKKLFITKAPALAYAAIATAAAIAIAAETELEHGLGKEQDLAWQCFIVFVVMVLQKLMIRRVFSKQDWLASSLFVCGCFFSSLPWLSTKVANNSVPWYLFLSGALLAILYIGMEGCNQTYQDKLYCELGTAITEQVFLISLFASVIRLIGFLWEFRCIESLVFHAKHPLSFASVLLLSFMGAAMAFLMSYMLRLCGALICVLIHQIMVNSTAGVGKEFDVLDYILKWGGILLMFGMLAITMLKMDHGSHKEGMESKFQLTDEDLEELDDPESGNELLSGSPRHDSHTHDLDSAAH